MSTNKLLDTIKSRRSIYPNMYTSEEVTKEQINDMLEASIWAPNHKKTQPWRYIVYHSRESRQRLSDYLSETYLGRNPGEKYNERKHKNIASKPLESGVAIAIIMQRDPMESIPEWEELAAMGASVQNMLLMAHELGLGAYWSSTGFVTRGGEDFFSLAEGQRCLGIVFAGQIGDLQLSSPRKSVDEVANIL